MSKQIGPITGVVTTDLSAITRGRFVAERRVHDIKGVGVGWIPSNLSLTAFNLLAKRNIWHSTGDLRLIPDGDARYRSHATGAETAFDMIMGDLVELDGSPWIACPRALLKNAVQALHEATGFSLKVSFEQEFYLFGTGLDTSHSLSFSALRQLDPFASQLIAALNDAGIDSEVVLAELGPGQMEISIPPTDPLAAADRAIAVREITREIVRNYGWRSSFSPKPIVDQSGNGVHVHFSLINSVGEPIGYDVNGPAHLSPEMAAFCAGILHHLPAILALTASSVPSYYRLKPYNWSSSYTWLAQQDREATLRVCPALSLAGLDPASQINVEYRAADATANPYLALAVLIFAGLEGLRGSLKLPPLSTKNPEEMSQSERHHHCLTRLPDSLEAALAALEADKTVQNWLPKPLIETFFAIKRFELEHVAHLDQNAIIDLYRDLY